MAGGLQKENQPMEITRRLFSLAGSLSHARNRKVPFLRPQWRQILHKDNLLHKHQRFFLCLQTTTGATSTGDLLYLGKQRKEWRRMMRRQQR